MSVNRAIGIMTSGGDCAGLNAVVRAVACAAHEMYGWKVYGILDGTSGLITRPLQYIELGGGAMDASCLRSGGTFLGTTSKGDPLQFPMPDGSYRDFSPEFAEGARMLGLDAVVVVGGDGSMRITSELCRRAGLGMVGIPKTIDNDVHGTDYAVGFATAVDVATEALDRLHSTAASHHRAMILEVMGRDAGYIAMTAGIAGGADIILVPELPYTLEEVSRKIRAVLDTGRSHVVIVVAEGVRREDGQSAIITYSGGEKRYGGIGHYLADRIAGMAGIETRPIVLGHLQRGGIPSARDRLIASAFGTAAVDLVAEGAWGRMVAWKNGTVTSVPLEDVTTGARLLAADDVLVCTAKALGIYTGGSAPLLKVSSAAL
ncbi:MULTISPECIES: ATP-dependent 6-phosphofructokinase [unclassified Haematospirillum]|uniref:ATP-dependent 6-phosphofructokinase n=1 Tax=unclassified Haematospirillum TaxID=2622088 RepID=UPI00143B51F4|nr:MULTISPECIES: ATP-dependent 6-phosphofructokinase [unclassified Haematospirillum]NKD54151.1 ATP-dependent 6-phosphofructokinase [Haematospirillum sp. H4890]NKD74196.1 ATP-dependent 6-phosphofructokinase [Haematospirillum sp. H4485]